MLQVLIDNIDKTSLIDWESFAVESNKDEIIDTVNFRVFVYEGVTFNPQYNQDVKVKEDGNVVFAGTKQTVENSSVIIYDIEASDYTVKLVGIFASKTYKSTPAVVPAYLYSKMITITGQTGAGTGFQVPILVGESSGSAGVNVHTNGHSSLFPTAKNISGDLRFRASDQTTELPFWVESVTGVTPNRVAKCWVKVSADLGTNQNIYLAYSGDTTNVSNGDNTFLLFDDFADGLIDANKWVVGAGSGSDSATEASDLLTVVNDAVSPEKMIQSKNALAGDIEMVAYMKATTAIASNLGISIFDSNQADGNAITTFFNNTSNFNLYSRATGTWTQAQATVGSFSQNVLYKIALKLVGSTATFKKDDVATGNAWTKALGTSRYLMLGARVWQEASTDSGTLAYDYVYAKKTMTAEPAFSTAGAEVTGTTTPATNWTVNNILTDLCSSFAPEFNATNAHCDFIVPKIVFNQVPILECIKKLASIVNFSFFIDYNKSIHFFNESDGFAPFSITDAGGYEFDSLERTLDGSQLVNVVKVRGGEYDGALFTDKITASGSVTKTFTIAKKLSNLTVKLNGVVKNVGIDNIDNFTTDDVLYNYNNQSIAFQNNLADGDVIEYSGNPKVRVFQIAEDTSSINQYGRIEKLIREDDIRDNVIARKRAVAELYAYSNGIIDARFDTTQSGLRVGQSVLVDCPSRNFTESLTIKTVKFITNSPTSFRYQVDLINTKRATLISILSKLLVPVSLDIDDTEVNEDIRLDIAELKLVEQHTVVSAFLDDADLEVLETHYINPLGAGVEPFWVLGDYFPTSASDPKRVGILDNSLTLY